MCQNKISAGRLGLRPRPRWGAYSAPPDPLAGEEGRASRPLPKKPTPASAFGLDFRLFGPQTSAPRCPPKYHYSPNTGAARIHTDYKIS